MKFLVWLLVIFAAAVAFALTANNPGYVLLVYPPYRIEFSLTLFTLSLLALLILSYFFLKLLTALLNLPNSVRKSHELRTLNQGRNAMMEALTAFFEGRYASAEKAANRAIALGDKSGVNSIIAARSAHELREFNRRDGYLTSIKGNSVGETTMRLIAQTEFMLDQQQPQLALNSLRELSPDGKQKHLGALQLELKAQQQARNWDAVLTIISQLEKRSAIAAPVAIQMRQQAWLEKLRAQNDDLPNLLLLWKSIPHAFKYRPHIAAAAASQFIKLNECKTAVQLLTDSLNTQWDSELVSLFGDCQMATDVKQIEQAEIWLKLHSDDAGLLLALGKLCLQQNLWGKAQSYLDASNSLKPSIAAYSALATLAEKLHKPDEASKYRQQAKRLA
jgi:HemY protein